LNKTIKWCPDCNIPILDNKCNVCSSKASDVKISNCDLKPIFPEEKDFYSTIIRRSLGITWTFPKEMCFESSRNILIGGKKVFRIFLDSRDHKWKAVFCGEKTQDLDGLEGSDSRKIIEANEETLGQLEEEAVTFLNETVENLDTPAIVSFSGGKDSACVLTLTGETGKNFPVIFLNSTIEFPETINYVHKILKISELNLIELLPEHDYFDLCLELGPPSCFMPWCCQTQKFAPLSRYINQHYPKGVVSIEGLTRFESRQRMKYNRISSNKAMPEKIAVSPILNWSAFEVWLYMLWKKVPINPLYQHGFKRVGCWICPHKNLSDFRLTEQLHPELMRKWHNFIFDYARKMKKDSAWVLEGKWRCRREAYNLICLHKKIRVDCSQENSSIYEVSDNQNLSQLIEYLKVFGNPVEVGNSSESPKIYCIKGKDITILFVGKKIHVTSNERRMRRIFERQLLKAFNCIKCGTCMGTCKAIRVENKRFSIDSDLCKNCLKCTSSKYLRMGCIALNYKRNRFTWNEIL